MQLMQEMWQLHKMKTNDPKVFVTDNLISDIGIKKQ